MVVLGIILGALKLKYYNILNSINVWVVGNE